MSISDGSLPLEMVKDIKASIHYRFNNDNILIKFNNKRVYEFTPEMRSLLHCFFEPPKKRTIWDKLLRKKK